MSEAESKVSRPKRRRYEVAVVMVFMAIFVVLWLLSLASVRAAMAARAWEAGDVERAHRLAALATRQRPEMADMWLLQARCEESLAAPCAAAVSYARAALAAGDHISRQTADLLPVTGDLAATAREETATSGDILQTSIRQSLSAAAECREVSTIATVFEALTVGQPSSPESRGGIWPGDPSVAGSRPTAVTLAAALPEEPELQFRWIEFFWRRHQLDAAAAAADSIEVHRGDLSAAGLWLAGRALLESGKSDEAVEAFQQALREDPGWIPASVSLTELAGASQPSQPWNKQALALDTARIEAEIYDARPDVLLLATNGSVTFDIATPTDAERVFLTVNVRGTPAHGRFPELTVLVDGVPVSALEATDPALPVIVEVPSGGREPRSVSFVFDNDWADETGDRNVFFSAPALYVGN